MAFVVDLKTKLATFTEAWQPRTVALFNGHDIMVAKLRGKYHWHVHPDTDDFFLVLEGDLQIDLEDGSTVSLKPGQVYIVPRGIRHRPRAHLEAHIMLIEPTGTPNSGDPLTAAPRRVV
ncbi:Mannose-6-phosphate isomerase, cupin superfamily [Massilia sp. CF038]|nr:Mannose-6-phosphate isomerase, cupin superfamily [Massilia sp. CF038]